MSTTPTDPEVLRGAINRVLANVRGCAPAVVTKFDSATRRCSAKIIVPEAHETEEGERVVEHLPVITEIPVAFYGSGGCRVKMPVHVGDEVLLVFSRAPLDAWLEFGTEVSDPGDERTFQLTDAIAIPGVQSEYTDSAVQIEFTETQIKAGGDEKLALRDELNDLRSEFNSHVHSGVETGGGTSGTPTSTVSSYPGTQILRGA